METKKLTKGQISFLTKVEAGHVARVRSYSMRKGGHEYFVGGEKTAERMIDLGLIEMSGTPELGRPSRARLTSKGMAALQAAREASNG